MSQEKYQKICATGCIISENKILLLKRSENESFLPGFYEMPGGKVDFGESPKDGLAREIREETGIANLQIEDVPYHMLSYVSEEGNRHTTDMSFLVTLHGTDEEPEISESHDDYGWFTQDEIETIQISDEMKNAVYKGFTHAADKALGDTQNSQDEFLRMQAEMQNYKRRMDEEKQRLIALERKNVVIGMLPFIDTFDLSAAYLPDDLKDHPWAQGVMGMRQKLEDFMKEFTIEKENSQWQKLDPQKHDALMQTDGQKDMVVQVFEEAYTMNGELLRPAKVSVGNGNKEE